ncbi:MAG: glycosyltransferase family 39 protein [Candidatus Bathyarchaeota archaeon]|nr:glycosyltransferase family 39 protein [Candidatus Bathyarchaeota archaeon]
MNYSSSTPRFAQLKTLLNEWRLAFLLFASAYAAILLLHIADAPLQWDEIVHLNDGLFLLRGNYSEMNSFYPPLFDVATAVFFKLFGVSVLSGRLVSMSFSLLSLCAVFELAYRLYNGQTALLASVLLGIMPGYLWISRMTMTETMLLFFFVASLFFFFKWLRSQQRKVLVISGLALGLGFLTKYPALIATAIMTASIPLLDKFRIRPLFAKFTILLVTVLVVATPWIVISYQIYASKMLDEWLYALQVGNPEKALYSTRFPLPIFYLIEMTWPYNDTHPISFLFYIISMLGLGLFAWRRKSEDKFLIVWFTVVYIFFSLVSNKHWRYVMPLFPVLAVSASALIVFLYNRLWKIDKNSHNANKKRAIKAAGVLFTVLLIISTYYSASDAYEWVARDQVKIDIESATNYAANRLSQNESIMLLCPFNLFSSDMVRFYLWVNGAKQNHVYQYPQLPVDTYTPSFNITELICLCKQHHVKYVFTYEFGGTVPYFNTSLNLQAIYILLYESGNFTHISDEATFGSNPRRIFVLTFLG